MTNRIFKISFIILFSLILSACNSVSMVEKKNSEQNQSIEEKEETLSSKEEETPKYDFTLPEEIRVTVMERDLFARTYDMWIDYISEINDGNPDLTFDDCKVRRYGSEKGFIISTLDNERTLFGNTQIGDFTFNDKGLIKGATFYDTSKSVFSITGLQVGDNARDYLNSCKEGLWQEFMELEHDGSNFGRLYGPDNMTMMHTSYTYEAGFLEEKEVSYEMLLLSNFDYQVQYDIRDEIVEHIYYGVNASEDKLLSLLEKEFTSYDLRLLVDGELDLLSSSPLDWVNYFKFQLYDSTLYGIKWSPYGRNGIMAEFDVSRQDNGSKIGETDLLFDLNVESGLSLYDLSHVVDNGAGGASLDGCGDCTFCTISFKNPGSSGGNVHRTVTIYEAAARCPRLYGNGIFPGKNIKEYLDSFEEGLFEKIIQSGNEGVERKYIRYGYSKYDDPVYGHSEGISIEMDERKRTMGEKNGINFIGVSLDGEIIKTVTITKEIERLSDFFSTYSY